MIVILFTMFLMNPVFLFISLSAAFTYSVVLKGRRALRFNILFCLPMLLIIAVINPVFVHEGKTVLFLLKDTAVTLESVCYGLSAATMLVSVLLWFSCYNEIMSTDKFIYLFSKPVPSLSLFISMTLRLIPNLKRQAVVISHGQKALGMGIGIGSVRQCAKQGMRIFSILMTWALENAVGTADSMKARGYGLPNRTTFCLFRFELRDWICLGILGGAAAICIGGVFTKSAAFQYYPSIQWTQPFAYFYVMVVAYVLICFLPTLIEVIETLKWPLIRNKNL